MKIKVLSREQFEEFTSDEKYIVISITDPNSEEVESQHDYFAMLSLSFYDLDKDTEVFPYSRFMFKDDDAHQILDFVKSFRYLVDLCVVHCEAGISRSAGVAGALAKIFNEDDKYYFDHYLPNMLVYSKILKVYYDDYV